LYAILKWSVLTVAISTIGIWFLFPKNTDRPTGKQEIVSQPDTSGTSFDMTPVTPIDSAPGSAPKEKISSKSSAKDLTPGELVPPSKKSVLQQNAQAEIKEAGYMQAEPLLGYPDLYEYFNANLVYPPEALKDSIQGVQTVSFVINAEGKPEQIEVVKSLGEPFEKEVKRLIENMPEWKPATLNGKPVSSKISLPLTFQIQKIKK
jgi:TonB family protein